MDTAPQWLHQGFNGVVINKPDHHHHHQLENSTSKAAAAEINSSTSSLHQLDKTQIRAKKEQPLNCPRCNSPNTKFCYYNNYSLSQPRHFCKTCKRYWTQGGSLRNIPVGGASRKNRRSSSSSTKEITITPPNSNPNFFIHGATVDQSQNPSLTLPMNISSGYNSTNNMIFSLSQNPSLSHNPSLFPFQESKQTMNYFAGVENGVHLHRQAAAAMATANGLFDQIGRSEGDNQFGLNNGMFGGGSPWQI